MRGFSVLNTRGLLAVTGTEAYTFLDALITNSISPDRPIYAALLTPQGRFLHDFFVIPAETDRVFIDCEKNRLTDLKQRLERYRLRRALTIEDVTDSYVVLTVPAGVQEGTVHFADPRHAGLGQRALLPAEQLQQFRATLQRRNIAEVDATLYRRLLLDLCIPSGSADMTPDQALPLEYNLDRLNGISFSKGCYIGQELTARMHLRDAVRKRLVRVRVSGDLPPPGSAILCGAEEAGELRSGIDDTALAIVRPELHNRPLTVNGIPLSVLGTPS